MNAMGTGGGRQRRARVSREVTILLVDDCTTVLMSMKMLLAAERYRILTAFSGAEALRLIGESRPDLIVSDIIMPGMTGVDLCRDLRQNPVTRHIPIIMVTTQGQEHWMEQAFAAGCSDYLTKPVDGPALLAKIRRHVPNRAA